MKLIIDIPKISLKVQNQTLITIRHTILKKYGEPLQTESYYQKGMED